MMTQRCLLQRVAFLLSMAPVLSITSGCMSPKGDRPVSMYAVVDIDKIFNGYRKSEDRKRQIDEEADGVMQEVARMRAEEKAAKDGLEKHPEGSPEHEEAKRKIDELKSQEPAVEGELRKVYQRRDDVVAEINLEIAKEIRRVASERNLDVVFEKRMVLKGLGPRPFVWPLVHYVKPHVEITSNVLDRLNEKYLKERATGGIRTLENPPEPKDAATTE